LPRLRSRSASYRFQRYRKADALGVRLVPPDGIDVAAITRMQKRQHFARDLINTPANDMGPEELASPRRRLHSASVPSSTASSATIDPTELFRSFMRWGWRRRARRADRFDWGDPAHPKVTWLAKGSVSIPAGWI